MPETAINQLFELGILPESLRDQDESGANWAIALALIAYAAGDAFGAAHEFVSDRSEKIISELLGKPDWPYGGVSDDTTLSLLTIESLQADTPDGAAESYLQLLKNSQETLRGLGPTTRYALGMSVKPEEIHYIGISNGGMMRTALLGMLFTPDQSALRESWIRSSVETTHKNPIAVDAALDMSAAFSGAATYGNSFKFPEPSLGWEPPANGISLNPRETYQAVMYVVNRCATVESAYLLACELGGDTDTVAALSGALVAASRRKQSGLFEIGWLLDVRWSEIPQSRFALELMMKRREGWNK